MKYSQFNSVIPFNDKYALYNSFNNRVIFIEETLKEILQAAVRQDIDDLETVHPTFYKYLVEQNYLVDEAFDEIEALKKVSKKIDESDEGFFLTINPSMNCNFKCWYCYETHVKDSSLNEQMIDKINKFIVATANRENLKYFTLSFFGGEPLLYFKRDVIPIIDVFKDICKEKGIDFGISFTTNGYLINQNFIDYFDSIGLRCNLQITLDGYKEEHDLVRFVSARKGSYDEIIANIKLLILNKFNVRLRINYTDKNLPNAYKISEEFLDIPQAIKDEHLFFDYHRVWQNDKVDDLHLVLDKNAEAVRNNGVKVATRYSPDNVKNSCYADKRNSVVINYNGDLFKCTARDFTNVKRAGYLSDQGELIWENDYLNKRMEAKFNNKPCLVCRLTPLCNGGCSQHALEHLDGDDYCVYFGDESEKDKVIKSKIQDILNEVVPT